jgi:hypothetical protein
MAIITDTGEVFMTGTQPTTTPVQPDNSRPTSTVVPIKDSKIIKKYNELNDQRGNTSRGIFANFPLMTPKYARHNGLADRDGKDTLARMYIKVGGEGKSLKSRITSISNSMPDAESKELVKVLLGSGKNTAQVNRTDNPPGYIDFFLQHVQQSFAEKVQVVDVLEDNYVAFFFGQQPPTFTFTGTVLNTYQDDWAMRLLRIYRDLARGTQLARRGLLFYIRYDSVIASGAMLNLTLDLDASNETAIPFSFQLLVKKLHIVYGSYAPPTELGLMAGAFVPDGYNIIEPRAASLSPQISKGEKVKPDATGINSGAGPINTQEPTTAATPEEADKRAAQQETEALSDPEVTQSTP